MLLFFNIVNGQSSNNIFNNNEVVFSDNDESLMDSEFEEGVGDYHPEVQAAPINDYLPLLAVAAVGLGFYYRKELNQTIKSN